MRGKLRILLAAASIVAVVLVAVIATTGAAATTVRFKVVEHGVSDTVVDIGQTGDSTGDLLTFHNPLFRGKEVVGHDQGTCIRIAVGKSWECTWTNRLKGGSISVEGPFFDKKDSTLSVIGGTGAYKSATGQMELHALNDVGSRFSFAFTLKLVS
jgi:allene oxide cyclase